MAKVSVALVRVRAPARMASRWSTRRGSHELDEEPVMSVLHVDCDTCVARGPACGDCVITVLLGAPGDLDLDHDEQAALSALADSGLVPPLRLVPGARRGRSVQGQLHWQDFG